MNGEKISLPVFSVKNFSEGVLLDTARLRQAACGCCPVYDVAVCASLHYEMFSELDRIRTDRIVGANEILFEEGDEKKFVYTVREGMLRLFTLLPDGRRQISVFLMRGDFVGLIDNSHYVQTAEAVITSRLCCFKKTALDEMIKKYPHMNQRLLCMTSQSLRYEREKQFLLGRMTPLEKVARFIILRARQAREKGLPDDPVHLAMQRVDIADYLGLTVETVSRCLSRLKAHNVIRFSGTRLITIVKRDALCLAAGLCINDN